MATGPGHQMISARAPWREWTLVHLIRRQAGDQGDRAFVRFEDGQAFSFRALDAWTDELAWDPLESTCRHASLSIL